MKSAQQINEIKGIIKYIFWTIMIVFLLFILFLIFNSNLTKYVNSVDTNLASNGLLGDYIGGLWGTLISIGTLIFVALTYSNQRKELKETRDQIAKQQFEVVFFNMLDMIHTLGKDFNQNGKDFFLDFLDSLCSKYVSSSAKIKTGLTENNKAILEISKKYNLLFHNEGEKNPTINNLKENGLEEFSNWRKLNIENEMEYIGIIYRNHFYENNSQLGHFFRYIHNTIKYAINERVKYGDEKMYINLLQSQLTNSQLSVMFYNCISPLSLSSKGIPKMKNWLDKYNVFQNIPIKLLIRPNHQDFYKKTNFKHPHIEFKWSEEDFNNHRISVPSLSENLFTNAYNQQISIQ